MANIILRPSWQLPESAATPEHLFRNRREFLKTLGVAGLAAAGLPGLVGQAQGVARAPQPISPAVRSGIGVHGPLPGYSRNPRFAQHEYALTRPELAGGYNNFYEFSYDKGLVKVVAKDITLHPYTLLIDGLVEKPVQLDLGQIEALGMEERIYHFRCVETWAMTVPWLGVPLASVLKKAAIRPEAKFVAITSFYNPEAAPQQRDPRFTWPYYEGLRLDEAMNPLAFVTTGMYGQRLPPQNGTPLRLVLPWKYGFKSSKSIVRLTLTPNQPRTFWNDAIPNEYKFEANVEPDVPHPRWSQAAEWHLNTGQTMRFPTKLYNGYAEQVAHLYPRSTQVNLRGSG